MHKRRDSLHKSGSKLLIFQPDPPPTRLNLHPRNKCISIDMKTRQLARRNLGRRGPGGVGMWNQLFILPFHLMTTFISQQRAQQSIKRQLAFIMVNYLTMLIPPVWNVCAPLQPNGSRRGGMDGWGRGLTVFQPKSLTSAWRDGVAAVVPWGLG